MINQNKQRINHIIQHQDFAIWSRVLAAIVGGYVLSNIIAILLSYLSSGSPVDKVMTATVLSYLIYAVIIIWIFSGKTLTQVWRTLTLACLVGGFCVYLLMPEGLF